MGKNHLKSECPQSAVISKSDTRFAFILPVQTTDNKQRTIQSHQRKIYENEGTQNPKYHPTTGST